MYSKGGACLRAVHALKFLNHIGDSRLERRELFLCQLIHLHPRVPEALDESRFVGFQLVPPPVARLRGALLDEPPGILLQALPNLGIGDKQVVFIAVVPDGHILLDFIHLGRLGDGAAVFLPVNGTLLDGGKDLAPAHSGGVGPQSLEGTHVHGGAGHADFQALQVPRLGDGPHAVGQLAEAVVERAKVSNPFPCQHLGVVFAASGVDDLPRLLVGGEGPGDGGYGDIRLQVSQDAGGVGPQVGAAYGDILHALGAVAARQGVVGEHVDDHIPAGPLHHQLSEVVGYQRVDLGIGSFAYVFSCL